MSRFSRPIPQIIEPPPARSFLRSTGDGFASLGFSLLLLSPEMESGTDFVRVSIADRLRQAQQARWPAIWNALVKGELTAYGGPCKLPISRTAWANVSPEIPPVSMPLAGVSAEVAPLVRVGDLEWFIPWQQRYSIWTIDQALMWICARDSAAVECASPEHGEHRTTWADFANAASFPLVLPGDAMPELRAHILASRLTAWSGLRAFNPNCAHGSQWHQDPSADPLCHTTLKTKRGELHGLVLDPVQVMARYPPIELETTPPDITPLNDAMEPMRADDDGNSPGQPVQISKASDAAIKRECEAILAEYANGKPGRPSVRSVTERIQMTMNASDGRIRKHWQLATAGLNEFKTKGRPPKSQQSG